ncbi:PIN domain-containing protein [Candidatus Woesearchaeota archaeon]|nr:PIN domain-containing protein [Candidatus Woesearchaeota archaeon]
MSDVFFLDTYAIFEIIRGNPNYKPYIDCRIITTIFNLAELNYNLKKEKDKKSADEYTDKYSKFAVDVSIDDIKRAMDFKSIHRKLSIPDAVGCTVAKKYNVKFLTGDKDFEGMENVEFVK